MIMWAMSDRAIPRSFRMMEGFGVHTFRLVNEEGQASFVKFHWKPKLGVHSVVWDEAQKLNGKNRDFHRQDLYESIENGNFPEFELGVQIIDEEDEFKFDFDILDPTKLWQEEVVPVIIIGKMTLNRNVDNVFAETEQAAFHPGNVVPGIDFTNDPLLQGRLFSYTDTQLIRLGGPNFHELPINRPVCPFHNNQRDGYGRQKINMGQVSYHKNSLADNTPSTSSEDEGGYTHYQEKIEGRKIQARSDSFKDHFSQAILFWNSMSNPEKEHIISAFSFELGMCKEKSVRQQVVDMLANISLELAKTVAQNVGVSPPSNFTGPQITNSSPALSQENTVKKPDTRKIAVLIGQGFIKNAAVVIEALENLGTMPVVISEKQGRIQGREGSVIQVDQTFLTSDSVLFDSVYVIGGADVSHQFVQDAAYFIKEAFSHYKPIGASYEGAKLLDALKLPSNAGIIKGDTPEDFLEEYTKAIAEHRFWNRKIS